MRTWPVLDPLLSHVRSVAGHADEAGIAAPTARLMDTSAQLLVGKALYVEAEPLIRRSLALCVVSLSAEHPNSQTVTHHHAVLLGEMGHGVAKVLADLSHCGVN